MAVTRHGGNPLARAEHQSQWRLDGLTACVRDTCLCGVVSSTPLLPETTHADRHLTGDITREWSWQEAQAASEVREFRGPGDSPRQRSEQLRHESPCIASIED